MADDKSKKGPQDPTRINLTEDYEVRYWSKKLRVTPDRLRAAIEKAGDSVKAVERELKTCRPIYKGSVTEIGGAALSPVQIDTFRR